MNSKYNRAILIGVLGGILVVVCALGATAQTLMSAKEIGKSITVGIETTAASTLERSYDNNTPDIIRYSTRWKPSERFLTVSATPLRQLTVSTKLDIGGNIEDKPRSVNPVTGIIFDSEILRGFVGDVHHFELETSWRFNKFISATAGYMRYELAQESELRYPFGAGYITSEISSVKSYQGFQIGIRSDMKFGKLGVEPVFLYYPSLDTSYDSHQFTMGADFINHFPEEDMTTRGYLMEGKITYDLVPRLAVTFGYSFQRLMSSDVNVLGPTNEYLASRSATFGLRTGF